MILALPPETLKNVAQTNVSAILANTILQKHWKTLRKPTILASWPTPPSRNIGKRCANQCFWRPGQHHRERVQNHCFRCSTTNFAVTETTKFRCFRCMSNEIPLSLVFPWFLLISNDISLTGTLKNVAQNNDSGPAS